MATLGREWVSVEQAEQWIATYDPGRLSVQVGQAIGEELRAGKQGGWFQAIVVDQRTNVCHDGLMQLRAIVKERQGQMCWIARADDFHFSAAHLERTAEGYQLVTRKMDTVKIVPLTIIAADDLPEPSDDALA